MRWFVAACLGLALFACGRVDPEAELAAAIERLSAGYHGEAWIRLSNVIQVQPQNADARRLRGELALLLGDYAAAAEELERAQALGAPLGSVAVPLADAWTALGQAERAVALLEDAEAALADSAAYWTARAEALVAAGRADEAAAALDASDRAGGGGARAQIVRARVALLRGDSPAAEALLDAALAGAPDDPRVLVARAELLARTERFDRAAADLRRAADAYRSSSLVPRQVATLLALTQVYLAKNDLDAAEATAAELAEIAPDAALTTYFRGLVAYRRGQLDEAATLMQPLVGAFPETPQFRALLGAIHLARGNLGQAEVEFRMVLAQSPRDPAAVKLLAETHLRQQRPEAALEALRTVQDAVVEDPQIGLLSGVASLLAGDAEQGLLYLEQAASLDPTNELLKLQLARAYLAAGRDEDASALLQSALEGGPAALEARLLQLFAEMRLARPDAGRDVAEELLADFPEEPQALLGAAMYFQLRGETQRARELFERAARLETGGGLARLFLAAALVQEGRAPDAERLLREIITEQPDEPRALMALAELLVSRGAVDEAAGLLRRAAEASASIAPRLALAQLLIAQGQLAEAQRELDVAAEAAPESAEVMALRGIAALAEGRAEDAVALLQRAEPLLPNRLGVTLALARAQLASGRPQAAKAALTRVLEKAPTSLPLRVALGEAELALGNVQEALSIAAALKAEFPAQSGGYVLEAEAQTAARRYGAAADSFADAYRREPSWRMLTRLLGALQLAGRNADVLRVAQEWVDANPTHLPGTLTLAGFLQQTGRRDEALRAYERALELDSGNLIALNNAAWLAHELGRAEALPLAERAYALAPDNPAVLDTLGWILLARNREVDGVAHLTKAAELAPDAPEIRYHLAAGLVAVGRSAEARAVLAALLEGRAEFEQRAEAQRLLDSL